MPNWTKNRLEITGPKTQRDALKEFVKGHYPDFKAGKFNYPDEKPAAIAFSFHSILPVPQKLLERTYGAEVEKDANPKLQKVDGHISGYDWCAAKWGTKWDAAGVKVVRKQNMLVYKFITAWAPPVPVILALSKKFPKLSLLIKYKQEEERYKDEHCVLIQDGQEVL